MIESGSCTPGISAADFALPPNTALRYERPADPLRQFFPSYAVLHSEAPGIGEERSTEWMLPTWAQIWIILATNPISVRIGNRAYNPLSSAILYGVTSRAMPTVASGGTTVVIDVSPLGWARFIAQPADTLHDRITPLTDVLPTKLVLELVDRLQKTHHAPDIKAVIDDILLRHLPPPNRDEPSVAKILACLTRDDIAHLPSDMLGTDMSPRKLRRLSKRYFGFPPKLLMIRARIIKAVVPMLLETLACGDAPLPAAYHDASHFNRDGRRFLGMTPKRFAVLPTPYLRAALRARQLIIGSATPSLDRVCPVSTQGTKAEL